MKSEKQRIHLEKLAKARRGISVPRTWKVKRKGSTQKCESCGKEFYVYPSREIQAEKRGITIRYCKMGCYSRAGDKNYFWKGGVYIGKSIRPRINGIKTRLSRIIAEERLGRRLKKEEVVHHINKDTLDNRPENLYVFPNISEHSKHHSYKLLPELKSNL